MNAATNLVLDTFANKFGALKYAQDLSEDSGCYNWCLYSDWSMVMKVDALLGPDNYNIDVDENYVHMADVVHFVTKDEYNQALSAAMAMGYPEKNAIEIVEMIYEFYNWYHENKENGR